MLLVAGESASERDGAWCGLLPKRLVSMNTLTEVETRLALRMERAASVCSKRGGPHNGGKPVGIEQATHYTRAPGPESVPVTTPEHWRPIIERCVRRGRQALLAGLEPLLRSPGGPVSEPGETLRQWHEAAHRKFLEGVGGDRDAVLFTRAHYQFTYRIEVADGQRLDTSGFVDELRTMGYEVMQLVNSGWSMFEILNVTDLMPRWTIDDSLGEEEFLECDFVSLRGSQMMPPEMEDFSVGYGDDGPCL